MRKDRELRVTSELIEAYIYKARRLRGQMYVDVALAAWRLARRLARFIWCLVVPKSCPECGPPARSGYAP